MPSYRPFEAAHGDQRIGLVVDTPTELTTRGKDGKKKLDGRIELIGLHDEQRDNQIRRDAKQKIEKALRETLPTTERGHELRAELEAQLRQYR